jgi:hypothetical protein
MVGRADGGAEKDLATAYPEKEFKRDYERLSQNKGVVRFVTLPFNDGGLPAAQSASAAEHVRSDVEKRLAAAGAERVDSDLAKGLEPIILECEAMGRTCGQADHDSDASVDKAITGKITGAQISTQFTAEKVSDKKHKREYVPARCDYKAKVSAIVNAYDISPLALAKTFLVEGVADFGREMSDPTCPVTKDDNDRLITAAISNALSSSDTELRNYFSPEGLIFRANVAGDTTFLQATLPSASVESGTLVKLFRIEKIKNDLGKSSVQQRAIGEGKVVKRKGGGSEAWIELTKIDPGEEVMKGDRVRVNYQAGLEDIAANTQQTVTTAKETLDTATKVTETIDKATQLFKGFFR